MFLTRQELIELTNRTRRTAQVRTLNYMGINHIVRPDGSVAVLRSHVEQMLCSQTSGTLKKTIEPNWGAIK